MSRIDNNLDKLIELIEFNKHDITMRLRTLVLDPIRYMNLPNSATSRYFSEQADRNQKILEDAESIMSDFSSKWRSDTMSTKEQLESIRTNIRKVHMVSVPKIHTIVEYYKLCANKQNYFTQSKFGQEALRLMTQAPYNVDKICKSLLDLEPIGSNEAKSDEMLEYNLIELVQEVMDDINELDMEVEYLNLYDVSRYTLSTDKNMFQNHVLHNIAENIKNHAFGSLNYKKKPIWEKKVLVEIKKENDFYVITVSNNGERFYGDQTKVLHEIYSCGTNKSTGKGMLSAKQYITKLGGTIEFVPYSTGKISVKHIIRIPVYGKV